MAIAHFGEAKRFDRVLAVVEGYDPDNPQNAGVKVLSLSTLNAAKAPGCSCEELGLRPGLSRAEINAFGAGCCDSRVNPGKGWVCPTLDKIRRTWDA